MSVVQHASGMHCWSICTFGYILTFSSDLLMTNYVVDKDYCRWMTRVFCDFCCELGDNINTYIYLPYSKIYRELIEIQTSSPPDISAYVQAPLLHRWCPRWLWENSPGYARICGFRWTRSLRARPRRETFSPFSW